MGTDPQYPLIFISDMRKILAFLLFRIFAFISAEAGSMEEQAGYCNGNECCAAETLFQVERFEMVIFEAPEKVVQVVTYDNAAGLKFVDVPKHRDLMKTRHVTDMKDDRLSLQVMEEVKTCMVGKPRQHLPPKMERQLLCGFTEEFNTQHMFASPSATHQNLMFLPMAVVTHDQLPTKLRPHCPLDYKVQTFRWINKDEQVVSEDQPGDMIVRDPEIQRDYMNGDFLDLDEEKLPEGLINTTRVKRSTLPCMQINDNNQLRRGHCFWVPVKCERGNGCPATNIFYHCRPNPNHVIRTCEYILMCATITDNRCIIHSTSTNITCDICCTSDNCDQAGGRGLPACSAERGVEDTSTRKLQMIVTIKRFEQYRSDYPRSAAGVEQGAQISLEYHGKTCTTSVLPTAVPWRCKKNANSCTKSAFQNIHLNTKATLGSCWDEDISQGSDPMTIKLKLPSESPIVVSSAIVFDESDESRCWKSDWRTRYSNYNQQTNDWVTGNPRASYGEANNFDDECMPIV